MADNTTIRDAADTAVPIATDDVSGVQFQRVKLDLGGDGVSVPVVDALPVGLPVVSSAVILSVTTDASGTGWVSFGASPCTHLDLVNTSAVSIEYRRGGVGSSMPIPAGAARLVSGIADASDISVRRVDQSTTPVTLSAEALT